MWRITLRDLQWRARRFTIATVATALVFAIALVLAGVGEAMRGEVVNTVAAVGADAWVVRDPVAGPFTGLAGIPQSAVADVARSPGVIQADPLLVLRQTVRGDTPRDVNVFGHRPGGLGSPPIRQGRAVAAPGEAVVDDAMGVDVGGSVDVGGQRFEVVGLTHGLTLSVGQPDVYMSIGDAQAIGVHGSPLVTAVVTRGTPTPAPAGLSSLSAAQVQDDLMRPLRNAVSSIDMIQFLLWLVAAAVIGSVVYLSATERVRDFAVLKATGSPTSHLFAGLAVQAMAVSLAASAVATAVALLLVPLFPLPVDIPKIDLLTLAGVALLVGLLASLAGLRRAVGADPALAFGSG